MIDETLPRSPQSRAPAQAIGHHLAGSVAPVPCMGLARRVPHSAIPIRKSRFGAPIPLRPDMR